MVTFRQGRYFFRSYFPNFLCVSDLPWSLHGILFAIGLVPEAQAQTPSAAVPRIREHQIIDTPRAPYTFQARENEVQGVVSLQVELKANGTIGEVTPLSTLPHGLTEQAISSARRLRFRPKTIDGVPVDVTVTVSYRFSLYYANSDPDIETRAQITSMPRPPSSGVNSASGKWPGESRTFLGPEGQVYVFQY